MTDSVADDIRRTLRRLTIATAALFVILILAVVWVLVENGKTTNALCDLRADLERRVHASEVYLDDIRIHPENAIPGITQAMVTRSLRDQRRSVDALSNLNCPPITFD